VAITFGDRVRTQSGGFGKVSALTSDGKSAYVQIDGKKLGQHLMLWPLDKLTKLNSARE
jgi:preprotein translocase subunit YajC